MVSCTDENYHSLWDRNPDFYMNEEPITKSKIKIQDTMFHSYGHGVKSSPRDPRFAGSNPAEVDGFVLDVKILSTSPPGGTLSLGVPSLRL